MCRSLFRYHRRHKNGDFRCPYPPEVAGASANARANLSTRRSRIAPLSIRVALRTVRLSLRAAGTIHRAGRQTPPAQHGTKLLVIERPHLAVAVLVGFEMQMPAVPGLRCVQFTVPHIAHFWLAGGGA